MTRRIIVRGLGFGPTGATGATGPAGPSGGPLPDLTGVPAGQIPITLGDDGVEYVDLSTVAVPKWEATTAYTSGAKVLNPDGDIVSAKTTFTSGASYSAANWNIVSARARKVDVLTTGAIGDGTADDTAAFTAAKAAAGAKGIVHFPAKPGATTTTYFFAGSSGAVDLSGTILSADPGVVLSVYSVDFIDVHSWVVTTPMTLYLRNVSATFDISPTVGEIDPLDVNHVLTALTPLLSLSNALTPDLSTWAAMDFTTWDKRNYSVAAGPTPTGAYTAGTSTTTTRGVTFTGVETINTLEGVYTTAARVGDEVSVKVKVGASAANGFMYASVNTTADTLYWVIPDTALSTVGIYRGKVLRQRKIGTAAVAADKTITPPEAVAYGPSLTSQPEVAIRITGKRSAELYVNGIRIDATTVAADIIDLGFALKARDYTSTSGASFADPILRRNPSNVGGRVIRIGVFGDSIAYGANLSVRWLDAMRSMLRGQPGVVDVELFNHAVPGHALASTKTVVNTTSTATYDYALILCGSNDVTAQSTQATFETDLGIIGAKIIADGSVPVFGLFPMGANRSQGTVGPTRANYAKGSYLRQALKWVCASNGYALADVEGEVGPIGATAALMPQLPDGLHPNLLGGVAVARAFSRVLLRLLRGTQATVQPAALMDGTTYHDQGTAPPTSGWNNVGDWRKNSVPTVGQPRGWDCTVSGNPGTWVAWANL